MAYQCILFDLDGTLTDPMAGITGCVQYALHKMGIEEPDLNKLKPFIGPPLLDSFHEFYGMDEKQGRLATEYYRERFSAVGLFENEVYPGIPELLQNLRDMGKVLAIASSKPTIYVKRILEHFGILDYFSIVVGSELDGTRTRKEEVVEETLHQIHTLFPEITKQEMAMVGDRKFDVEGARQYGLAAIAVSYGYAPEGELQAAGADAIVDSVEELGLALMR